MKKSLALAAMLSASTQAHACYGLNCEQLFEMQQQTSRQIFALLTPITYYDMNGQAQCYGCTMNETGIETPPAQPPPTSLFDRENRYGNGPQQDGDDSDDDDSD